MTANAKGKGSVGHSTENEEWHKLPLARKIWRLYADGFRQMTIGKTLWVIILIKLFVVFVIVKLLFFPNLLNQYSTDEEKATEVRKQLIHRNETTQNE